MTAPIPTCHNCTTTEALEEHHGLLICPGCWTIGGLLDDIPITTKTELRTR